MARLNGELFHWNKLKQETIPCPLCRSSEHRLYEKYGEERQYSLVRCRECSFIFQNPRFEYNRAFLDWAYSWYGEDFIRQAQSTYPSQEGNRYFAFKKGLIDKLCPEKPVRLLDVGAACGQFLSFCHGKSCVATGLETSADQVAYAKAHLDFEMIEGSTEAIQDRPNYFDVTHIAHTLEHVPDPIAVLLDLKHITKPGGFVFVEVPHVRSFKNYGTHLRSLLGVGKNTWKPGDFPEHLVEFTPKTLKRLLREVGLELVYFQCHSKSGLDKRPGLVPLDLLLNRALPLGNNLIAIGRKPLSA